MILELHGNTLHPIPAEPITVKKYYAVDYVSLSTRNMALMCSMVQWNYRALDPFEISDYAELEKVLCPCKNNNRM